MSAFCTIDDKHILLYRIVWVSALPHFCGSEDCEQEGKYEVHLENGDAIWAAQEERDEVLVTLEATYGDDEQSE